MPLFTWLVLTSHVSERTQARPTAFCMPPVRAFLMLRAIHSRVANYLTSCCCHDLPTIPRCDCRNAWLRLCQHYG